MRSTVLERVGYFHFVTGHDDPVKALTDAIEKTKIEKAKEGQVIANSLIVLPEAFNLGNYTGWELKITAGKTRDELGRLATLHSLAFVAGIIDGERNSAYWIDAGGSQLMCHKMGNDGHEYSPCARDCDKRNPVDCINARVGTLICMDVTTSTRNKDERADAIRHRRETIFHKVRSRTSARIICVPARFTPKSSDGTKPQEDLSGLWYIVANGSVRGHASSITTPAGKEIFSNGDKSEIKLAPLTHTLPQPETPQSEALPPPH